MATTPAGNEYELAVYVDPFPGQPGKTRVFETCGKCSGSGVVGYGNVTLLKGRVEDRWCFQCGGSGKYSFLVSSARSTARRQVKAENVRRAQAADYAANNAERELAELLADWDAALVEQTRRDALPKGFLGQAGERLRNLNAKVTLVRYYESQNYLTGRPESKCILKFDVLGRTAVTFAGHSHGLEEGQFVNLTGTVKDHSSRDGEDQTVLSRIVVK